jgi:hypothetical protein
MARSRGISWPMTLTGTIGVLIQTMCVNVYGFQYINWRIRYLDPAPWFWLYLDLHGRRLNLLNFRPKRNHTLWEYTVVDLCLSSPNVENHRKKTHVLRCQRNDIDLNAFVTCSGHYYYWDAGPGHWPWPRPCTELRNILEGRHTCFKLALLWSFQPPPSWTQSAVETVFLVPILFHSGD